MLPRSVARLLNGEYPMWADGDTAFCPVDPALDNEGAFSVAGEASAEAARLTVPSERDLYGFTSTVNLVPWKLKVINDTFGELWHSSSPVVSAV